MHVVVEVGSLQHSFGVHVLLAQTTLSFEASKTRFVLAQTLEACSPHFGVWFPAMGEEVGSFVEVVEVVGTLVGVETTSQHVA